MPTSGKVLATAMIDPELILKFISYKVIKSSGMTMLTSWKLDPHTVMRLKSGRRGNDVLKGGHLACSSHKPLTSSYSPVTKRLVSFFMEKAPWSISSSLRMKF